MNGYIVIDFSKYTVSELTDGVTIPGIYNNIIRARKPLCAKFMVGSNILIAYGNTQISNNSITVTCFTGPNNLYVAQITSDDAVTVTFP